VSEGKRSQRDGYTMQRLSYDAGGRRIPATLVTPESRRADGKTLLYLDQAGQAGYEKPGSDLDQFARAGYTVLAVDPSGIGETTPKWGGYSDRWFGSDRTSWLALMVGKPLVGLRMDDILRGVDLLNERSLLVNGGCGAFAKGLVAVDLLFAATVDDRLRSLYLEGGLISYQAVVTTPIQRRIFDAVVPGVLKHFDLPDLTAAMAPRPVRLKNLATPLGNTELLARARQAYGFATEAYRVAGQAGKLDIGLRREDESALEAYPGR
jgi:hypothetical protein